MCLEDKIKNAPKTSGCYIFLDKNGEIIYIGKSKNINKRMSQYFNKNHDIRDKVFALKKEIRDVYFLETETETDALIRECKLIKKHRPKYNSMLVENKSYPFLKINLKDKYPNFIIEYKKNSENLYFGCFYSLSDAERHRELISDIWKTPICHLDFSKPKKPCLRYYIKKCLGPCSHLISEAEYKETIMEACQFLKGEESKIFVKLNQELENYSVNLEFERAGDTLQKINKLKNLKNKLNRITTDLENRELFLYFRAFNEETVSLFYIKNSEIWERVSFNIKNFDKNTAKIFIKSIRKKVRLVKSDFLFDDENLKASFLLEISADKYFFEAKYLDKLGDSVKYLSDKFNYYVNEKD